MDTKTLYVPNLGDFDKVEVIEVLVKVGDRVQIDDALITLETNKASMDIPAEVAGTVQEILLKTTDHVSQGDAMLVLALDASEDAPAATDADSEPPDTVATMPATPDNSDTPSAPDMPDTPKTAPATAETKTLYVPDLGDFEKVEIIEVLVKAGDKIAIDDALITLETDKASIDVPAEAAGTIQEMLLKTADRVSQGDAMLVLKTDAPATSEAVARPATTDVEQDTPKATPPTDAGATTAPSLADTSASTTTPVQSDGNLPHASPIVRRYARTLGVDLQQVSGTGPQARVLEQDIHTHVAERLNTAGKRSPPTAPPVDFSAYGPTETLPLSRIRKLSAQHLQSAWAEIPHVTHHAQADITELEQFRKSLKSKAEKYGTRISALVFHIKVLAHMLGEFPNFCASLDPDCTSLIYKRYRHIGFAVDTPAGLLVPVIRDVDKKGLFTLSMELGDIIAKARDGSLKADAMRGGCITISSLGGIGGHAFSPIINAPEVAILGISEAKWQPVWSDGQFVPRLICMLSLSYDHRAIDGAMAARFMKNYCEILGDIPLLLM